MRAVGRDASGDGQCFPHPRTRPSCSTRKCASVLGELLAPVPCQRPQFRVQGLFFRVKGRGPDKDYSLQAPGSPHLTCAVRDTKHSPEQVCASGGRGLMGLGPPCWTLVWPGSAASGRRRLCPRAGPAHLLPGFSPCPLLCCPPAPHNCHAPLLPPAGLPPSLVHWVAPRAGGREDGVLRLGRGPLDRPSSQVRGQRQPCSAPETSTVSQRPAVPGLDGEDASPRLPPTRDPGRLAGASWL